MAERDWEAIERDYRDGRLSVCAIAGRHGLSEATVRRRAKDRGWRRTPHPADDAADDVVPDHAAILDKHRRAVTRLNRLHDDLADKAAGLVETAASLRDVADAAAAVERLGRIAERLITLERQVFGLDETAAGSDGLAEVLRKARERAGLKEL